MIEIDGEKYEFLLGLEGIEIKRPSPPVDLSIFKPIHCRGGID